MALHKISIIIPTFNRCNDLKISISSILEQTYDNYEVLIIDNGPSTDNTYAYYSKGLINNKKVSYIRTSLKGVTYARSIGNLICTGDIIIQMDDDVSFYDTETLEKCNYLFSGFQIDVLGFIERKTEVPIITPWKGRAITESDEFMLNKLGTISNNYDVTTGFENENSKEIKLYRVQSFRSCFMAYKKDVLKKVMNFDINYSKLSWGMGFREETDFLMRADNFGCNIFLSNLSSIHHRAGIRYKSVPARTQDGRGYFAQFACHAYFAVKDLLEKKQYIKLLKWACYQFTTGAYKNPGIKVLKQKGQLRFLPHFVAGFFTGIFRAFFRKRAFIAEREYRGSIIS